jgi:hypothetical protein
MISQMGYQEIGISVIKNFGLAPTYFIFWRAAKQSCTLASIRQNPLVTDKMLGRAIKRVVPIIDNRIFELAWTIRYKLVKCP